LIANGFYETMSFSCVSSDLFEKFDFISASNAVILQNPLSKNLDTMRQSLVFGALDAVARNINNQNPNIKFFEFGSSYFKNHNNKDFEGIYTQNYLISLTLTGLRQPNNWIIPPKNSDFYTLKTYTENL
jgi:phenylalanyl-tRNA synthetase beta chain